MVDYGCGLNRSFTVAELGSFIVAPYMYSLELRVNQGFTDTSIVPICPHLSRLQYEKVVVVLQA